jgi:mono/diheme cytochrome c family protein
MLMKSLGNRLGPFRLAARGIAVFLIAAGLQLFTFAPCTFGQDEFEEESPYAPGLVATMQATGDASATPPITRIDESLAFDWESAAPDPRLPADSFTATWRGRLWTQAPGRYELAVYAGGGKVSLRLAGKEVLTGDAAAAGWIRTEPIDLEFGRHELEVTFERTAAPARLALYWSGPNFVLEPVPARFLMHDRESSPTSDFERGRTLAAALRCAACHGDTADSTALAAPALAAPALEKLSGNLESAWLVDWLSAQPADGTSDKLVRRMPHFALSAAEAADVAAWLTRLPAEPAPESARVESPQAAKKKAGKAKASPLKPTAAEGERLFLTLGCLACHQHGELGESGLFGGGDLTAIASKRPQEFFARWLADPASLNRHHRMPVFDLSAVERDSLALWLSQQGKPAQLKQQGDVKRGKRLVTEQRCAACHALTGGEAAAKVSRLKALSAASDWNRSCAKTASAAAGQPRYGLAADDAQNLAAYYKAMGPHPDSPLAASPQSAGRDLLVELNCLACHAREGIDRQVHALPGGLEKNLAAVVAQHDALGKQVPAMTPPALNAVGDKLTDEALAAAIRREGKVHRPYLMARMPKFRLTDEQLTSLVAYFRGTDRIPEHKQSEDSPRRLVAALVAAGPRLVTTDGFGCTSCHQVGSVLPDKAPLNARGPDLSMLEKRIRREWFGRWCASPARIVPRMEMPSVQVPVRGVLGDNVHDQLAAVWHILNTPGFEPPEPNPVRVLRLSGVPEKKEQPLVLHDVIKVGDRTHLFPVVIGLPNRHNILYDLETGRLAAWWLGDMARQRTKGKSWFWEAGSKSILDSGFNESDVSIWIDGQEQMPTRNGQYVADLDLVSIVGNSEVATLHRLSFASAGGRDNDQRSLHTVNQGQHFRLVDDDGRRIEGGFQRAVLLNGKGHMKQIGLRLASEEMARNCSWEPKSRTLTIANQGVFIRVVRPPGVEWDNNGKLILREDADTPTSNKYGIRNTIGESDLTPRWAASVVIDYATELPVDRHVVAPIEEPQASLADVSIAPGFAASRLPLPNHIMPTAFTWNAKQDLLFASLKGEIFRATDTNGDSHDDQIEIIADGLATPYGIRTAEDAIDITTKHGLIRLKSFDEGRHFDWMQVIASGWGVTDDYHDWAVGLVSGDNGEYFVGLPCQQDQRSEAAAQHRGQLLKLVPRKTTPDNPRLFDIEVVSSGHRFPMGIARNSGGELFVTDNQGNYNPFNELNHVRPGAHFGFINALEKEKGFKPPRFDKPAVDIPHPWTRSVNGICFLETPPELLAKIPLAERAGHGFGPLEGHLVGCEYDTRALIRMSLQKVGDTYQGAAYPLSIPPDNVEDGLLGPIVCAVSPKGELYVGNIRDSGWGAGNNVGDIVRIKVEPEKLPCGIAEVRATSDGFTIDFFRPVDRAKALDAANYSLASYRRESTPAYGGPNLDRRSEKIQSLELSEDGKRVTLKLADLRAGFLYEFQLNPLTRGKELFHPAEAHYTLNQIP